MESVKDRGTTTEITFLVPLWTLRVRVGVTVQVCKCGIYVENGDAARVDALWESVSCLTRDGELGFAAKLSRRDSKIPAVLVYVEDFKDEEDKERVQTVMRALIVRHGIVLHGDSELSWKSDKQTQLGFYSSFARDLGLMHS